MKLKQFELKKNKLKKNWLVSGSYNPKLSYIKNYLEEIRK